MVTELMVMKDRVNKLMGDKGVEEPLHEHAVEVRVHLSTEPGRWIAPNITVIDPGCKVFSSDDNPYMITLFAPLGQVVMVRINMEGFCEQVVHVDTRSAIARTSFFSLLFPIQVKARSLPLEKAREGRSTCVRSWSFPGAGVQVSTWPRVPKSRT
ncbi:MAG: hypothetical protein KDB88_05500 [Flavobacteriales bacterium]|nr:hypothetical protein [Flavobacteriales bacterium]